MDRADRTRRLVLGRRDLRKFSFFQFSSSVGLDAQVRALQLVIPKKLDNIHLHSPPYCNYLNLLFLKPTATQPHCTPPPPLYFAISEERVSSTKSDLGTGDIVDLDKTDHQRFGVKNYDRILRFKGRYLDLEQDKSDQQRHTVSQHTKPSNRARYRRIEPIHTTEETYCRSYDHGSVSRARVRCLSWPPCLLEHVDGDGHPEPGLRRLACRYVGLPLEQDPSGLPPPCYGQVPTHAG